ncbi:MAG: hypothetical protein H6707_20425 [Deltaproteobacteria bacterium]|nr:hypothetical protein [Deltaproteobacteria bacterium]
MNRPCTCHLEIFALSFWLLIGGLPIGCSSVSKPALTDGAPLQTADGAVLADAPRSDGDGTARPDASPVDASAQDALAGDAAIADAATDGGSGAPSAKLMAIGGVGTHDPLAISIDDQGTITIAGNTSSSFPFTIGKMSVTASAPYGWVAQLAPDWTPRWLLPLWGSSTGSVTLGAFARSGKAAIIAGSFSDLLQFPPKQLIDGKNGRRFVARFDSQGTASWVTTFVGGDLWPQALAADSKGNVFVGGWFTGTATIGTTKLTADAGGKHDAFLAAFDPKGQPLWATRFGGVHDDDVTAIAVTATDRLFVGGRFAGTVSFDGLLARGIDHLDVFIGEVERKTGKFLKLRPFAGKDRDSLGTLVAHGQTLRAGLQVRGDISLDPMQAPYTAAGYADALVVELTSDLNLVEVQAVTSNGTLLSLLAPDLAAEGDRRWIAGIATHEVTWQQQTAKTDPGVYLAQEDRNPSAKARYLLHALRPSRESYSLGGVVAHGGAPIVFGRYDGTLTYAGTTVSANLDGRLFLWRP